jgi:hypothetical protein
MDVALFAVDENSNSICKASPCNVELCTTPQAPLQRLDAEDNTKTFHACHYGSYGQQRDHQQ